MFVKNDSIAVRERPELPPDARPPDGVLVAFMDEEVVGMAFPEGQKGSDLAVEIRSVASGLPGRLELRLRITGGLAKTGSDTP